ncbi:MAG: transcriptional repressor LexA [bacterium]
MRPLTERQRQILDYIIASIRDRDRFPSYREIGRRFRLASSATVSQHLAALVRKGFLTRAGRRLSLSPGLRPARGVPIVGKVAAGLPITAVENREGQLDLAALFQGEADHFAVRVKGSSMRDAGVLDGDYVIVRRQDDAQDGDTVVACLGNEEATVKVMRRRGGKIELVPRNPAYKSVIVDSARDRLRIAGKVVGLVRKLR